MIEAGTIYIPLNCLEGGVGEPWQHGTGSCNPFAYVCIVCTFRICMCILQSDLLIFFKIFIITKFSEVLLSHT